MWRSGGRACGDATSSTIFCNLSGLRINGVARSLSRASSALDARFVFGGPAFCLLQKPETPIARFQDAFRKKIR